MTKHSKRTEISALVEEAIADPSRAEAVKKALENIAQDTSGPTRRETKTPRPSRFDVEDLFDNLPV